MCVALRVNYLLRFEPNSVFQSYRTACADKPGLSNSGMSEGPQDDDSRTLEQFPPITPVHERWMENAMQTMQSIHRFQRHGNALARADAEADDCAGCVASLQGHRGLHRQARTAGAQRVTKRNGTPEGIHPGIVIT